MDAEYRMRLQNLSFMRKRTALKNNIKRSYERMQRERENYIAACDQCDIYQARIIETLHDAPDMHGNNGNVNKHPESPSAFEYKIDERVMKIIKTQDAEAKKRKLGLVTPKPVIKTKEEEEPYIPWHKQKNKRKILQFTKKIFAKLADRDPSKLEQKTIKDMVDRNNKIIPISLMKKKKSSKKKQNAVDNRKKKKDRKKSVVAIDTKLANRISKLEEAMSSAVISDSNENKNEIVEDKKKTKEKKKKTKEKKKSTKKNDNDKKDKKKKKKKRDTKWDDVDLKKIMQKEKALKKKLNTPIKK